LLTCLHGFLFIFCTLDLVLRHRKAWALFAYSQEAYAAA
jgi:hypothetical protein